MNVYTLIPVNLLLCVNFEFFSDANTNGDESAVDAL